MKTVALPILFVAVSAAGLLSACNKPVDREDREPPGDLPRETVPMSVPPMPSDPRPAPESTVPPDSPSMPESPSRAPPLGPDSDRPALSDDAAQKIGERGSVV